MELEEALKKSCEKCGDKIRWHFVQEANIEELHWWGECNGCLDADRYVAHWLYVEKVSYLYENTGYN